MRRLVPLLAILATTGAHAESLTEQGLGYSAARPFEVAQITLLGVGGVNGGGYTPPTLSGLYFTDGDSFLQAGGSQTWIAGNAYTDSAGTGYSYNAMLYGASGHLVMPAETYQEALSGSTPYGMVFRATSPRTDSGNYTATGATISGGSLTSLAFTANTSPGGTEAPGSTVLWPGVVVTCAGSGPITFGTTAASGFGPSSNYYGGPGTYAVSNPSNVICGSAALATVHNPGYAFDTNANDIGFSVASSGGGTFVNPAITAGSVINLEMAHNLSGTNSVADIQLMDQYFKALGPSAGTIGGTLNGIAFPTFTGMGGNNAIVVPDDNYDGGVVFMNQELALSSASVTPTFNAGLNISGGAVTSYFSDECRGYPATYVSNAWSGTQYNSLPVVFFGGTSHEAPTIGTRVASSPSAGQYTLTLTASSATYGFSAADVSNATQVELTYCSAASGWGNLAASFQLDLASYFTSTAADYVGTGTGTDYGVPGAAHYPWVHPALTFEASEDPASMTAPGGPYYWPVPVIASNSGPGEHPGFTGNNTIGKVVGQAIAAAASGATPIWVPAAYSGKLVSNIQLYKTTTNTNPISGTVTQSALTQLANGVDQIVVYSSGGGIIATSNAFGPGSGSVALSGTGISSGSINLTTGAWSITGSSTFGPNDYAMLYGFSTNPRQSLPANGQGPNILLNGAMSYDAAGANNVGGALAGYTGTNAINPPGCNSANLGASNSNYIPTDWTLDGNTTLGGQFTGSGGAAAATLSITCGYTASDPNGQPAFYMDVEGYFGASLSNWQLIQNIVAPISAAYLNTSTDKARAFVKFVVTRGSVVQSDGQTHLIGFTSPAVSASITMPTPSTIYARPCSAGSATGVGCTYSKGLCGFNAAAGAGGGEVLTEYGLTSGSGANSYFVGECLSPPFPLFDDAGGGTASSVSVQVGLPGEPNYPVSYILYIEDVDLHVAAQ